MATNIVLLADGTGNSSASPFKTNVWRLYQAVDVVPPTAESKLARQIVYYDNGVGTENFKPLAALGGAFGLGIWKNVKDLYTFVCRSYQVGDQVYGFGFSRGAFTIRLLMGLIGKCGIVKVLPPSESKLLEAIDLAFEAYRRDFLIRASQRRAMIYHKLLRKPRHVESDKPNERARIALTDGDDTIKQFFIDIRFLGVWDTVDAYGMPIDELKIAIDHWAWPMSFADRYPPRQLLTIRHALSLDDARPTFRPVLWSEIVPDPAHPGDQTHIELTREQIQQVWFAGVHANVGGGYPDDGLAYAALDWMMSEAEICGLRFYPPLRAEAADRVDPHGEQYDSRAGVAGYYRYGPRDLKQLCFDRKHLVQVRVPLVHIDAFDRIARHQRAYAPVSLNVPFQLIGGDRTQYPPASDMAPDKSRLELAWDIVWWRRIAYFATLFTTFFVALFFAALMYQWPNRILDTSEHWLAKIFGRTNEAWLAAAIQQLGSAVTVILPGWAKAVLPELSKYPLAAVISFALLALLFFWVAGRLQARIDAYAEWAWGDQKGLPADGGLEPTVLNKIARPGRKISAAVYRYVWIGLIVNLVGLAIGILVGIVVLPIMLVRDRRRRPWMA